jgi:hypothetical protein
MKNRLRSALQMMRCLSEGLVKWAVSRGQDRVDAEQQFAFDKTALANLITPTTDESWKSFVAEMWFTRLCKKLDSLKFYDKRAEFDTQLRDHLYALYASYWKFLRQLSCRERSVLDDYKGGNAFFMNSILYAPDNIDVLKTALQES